MNQSIRHRIRPVTIVLLAGGVLYLSGGSITIPVAFAADALASPAGAPTPTEPELTAPLTVPASGAGSSAAPAAAAAPVLPVRVTAPMPPSGTGTNPTLPGPMTVATPAAATAGEPILPGPQGVASPAHAGCEKDTDCKGDRICEKGECVSPGPGNSGSGGNAAAENPPHQAAISPSPHKHSAARETLNQSLSDDLTAYLHEKQARFQKRYCEVSADVYSRSSGAVTRIELSGKVLTTTGIRHAEDEAEDWAKEHGGAENRKINNAIGTNSSVNCGSAPAQGPPTGSGSAPAPGASAPADPCLCLKTENYCKSTCTNTAAASAPSSLQGSISGFFQQLIQPGVQLKQCNEDCEQKKTECVSGCGPSGGQEPQTESPDRPPAGPDNPPE